jgi:hypothetical protein
MHDTLQCMDGPNIRIHRTTNTGKSSLMMQYTKACFNANMKMTIGVRVKACLCLCMCVALNGLGGS